MSPKCPSLNVPLNVPKRLTVQNNSVSNKTRVSETKNRLSRRLVYSWHTFHSRSLTERVLEIQKRTKQQKPIIYILPEASGRKLPTAGFRNIEDSVVIFQQCAAMADTNNCRAGQLLMQ
ncbi:hypothetical protein SAMN04488502_10554 [Dendrosporobacter quercicolus]|uniref:Uncharacterized protein n=1 Tax=Dendrosporobacter quercicolus TaxID=146817 RepID=A0A1G9TQQ8_9FIRM|nr:hypothetical protein SAMN04488502_10554 [Dendrosporobacter quercicolus]